MWENPDYSYLLAKDNKIYCYQPLFEGRNFFVLDYKSGEVVEELGNAAAKVNELLNEESNPDKYKDYIFPETFEPSGIDPANVKEIIGKFREETVIAGKVNYAVFNSLLIFNGHRVKDDGKLQNHLFAYNLDENTKIIDKVLNDRTETFIPDSFFIKGKLLFLLKEKVSVVVYKIMN